MGRGSIYTDLRKKIHRYPVPYKLDMEKFNPEWAKDVPCRNIIIYGYCKKQKEGCPFKHDNQSSTSLDTVQPHRSTPTPASLSATTAGFVSTPSIPKFNARKSESFTPMKDGGTHVSNPYVDLQPMGTPGFQYNVGQSAPYFPSNYSYSPMMENASLGSVDPANPTNQTGGDLHSVDRSLSNLTVGTGPIPLQHPSSAPISSPTAGKEGLLSGDKLLKNETTATGVVAATATANPRFPPTSGIPLPVNASAPYLQHNFSATHFESTPQLPTKSPGAASLMANSATVTATGTSTSTTNINTNPVNPNVSTGASAGTSDKDQNNNNPTIQSVLSTTTSSGGVGPMQTLPPFGLQSSSLFPVLPIDQVANPPGSGPPPPLPPTGTLLDFKFPSIYPPPHSILQYHLYAPEPPIQLRLPLKPNERTPEMLFIPNDIREGLVKKNLAALQLLPQNGSLPEIVQDYFGLVSLDFHQRKQVKDRYNGHRNSLFKVFSNLDGKIYTLRRIHNVSEKIEPQDIATYFRKWKVVTSSNFVHIKDCFTTTKFGDVSLCFVYDYFPEAVSLYEYHFIKFPSVAITQDLLWGYLVQLINVIREIHSRGLVVGEFIDWDKVLVTSDPGRVKLATCNEVTLLTARQQSTTQAQGETPVNKEMLLQERQQADYLRLGELLFNLTRSMVEGNGKDVGLSPGERALDLVDKFGTSIDTEFGAVLRYLLDDSEGAPIKNVSDLSKLCIDKFFVVFDSLNNCTDYTESILARELENGRLFRLICKLNFIFGRIESRVDINWSESGEKFPIILFYDYVFHQVNEENKPVLDLTHVLRCLNKLDAGVQEKMVLVTPDEMNCIIISYRELKQLINATFTALTHDR